MGKVVQLFPRKSLPAEPEVSSKPHQESCDVGKALDSLGQGSDLSKTLKYLFRGMSITMEMDAFLRSLKGHVLVTAIASQRSVVAGYSDQQLREMLQRSTESQWKGKPAFFRTLSQEIRHRKLK